MKRRKTKKTSKKTLPRGVIKHRGRLVSPNWLELVLDQKTEHFIRIGMPKAKAEEEAIKSELGNKVLKNFQEYKKRLPKNKKPNIREFLKTIKI